VMLSYDAPFSSPKSFSLSLRKRENQCNIWTRDCFSIYCIDTQDFED
jgi:hypothetical protein